MKKGPDDCHPEQSEGSAFLCFQQETADASPACGISMTCTLFHRPVKLSRSEAIDRSLVYAPQWEG
jgi:hypothetical protein